MNLGVFGAYEFYIVSAYGIAGLIFLGIFFYSWIQLRIVRQKYKRLASK
ncbi:MAG: heme exporter protein CcmD [Caedimonas sp.]|nr:heme exporter protein CcmD [Caedimonas sp.]